MARTMRRTGLTLLSVLALSLPATVLAQGDPAPRGGAGTNLPAVNGAAAAADSRANNAIMNTPPVTTNPAGAPDTADRRTALRDQMQTREGPMSAFDAHQRLAAIREGRGSGSDTASNGHGWYGEAGGRATVRIRIPQPGPTGGNVPTAGVTDANECADYYRQMWGPTDGWHPQILAALSGCSDGTPSGWRAALVGWGRAEYAREIWSTMYGLPAPGGTSRAGRSFWDAGAYDPQMYWGNAHASGMGYSQRSGGFSRAYADAGLKLDVTPNDARVYVDGFYAGQVADFDGQIRRLPLNPGPHRVEFAANGLDPLVITAEVPAGQTATFTGQLTRKK